MTQPRKPRPRPLESAGPSQPERAAPPRTPTGTPRDVPKPMDTDIQEGQERIEEREGGEKAGEGGF